LEQTKADIGRYKMKITNINSIDDKLKLTDAGKIARL